MKYLLLPSACTYCDNITNDNYTNLFKERHAFPPRRPFSQGYPFWQPYKCSRMTLTLTNVNVLLVAIPFRYLSSEDHRKRHPLSKWRILRKTRLKMPTFVLSEGAIGSGTGVDPSGQETRRYGSVARFNGTHLRFFLSFPFFFFFLLFSFGCFEHSAIEGWRDYVCLTCVDRCFQVCLKWRCWMG